MCVTSDRNGCMGHLRMLSMIAKVILRGDSYPPLHPYTHRFTNTHMHMHTHICDYLWLPVLKSEGMRSLSLMF